MSQPVKLSDALVLDARIAGEAQERSIAGQVEFWARLGRSVELLLDGRQVLALRQSADAQPLSEALAAVETDEGRKRLQSVLAKRPYPHFEQAPGHPGFLVRIDEDGTRTVGRFVNREFVEMEVRAGKRRFSIGRDVSTKGFRTFEETIADLAPIYPRISQKGPGKGVEREVRPKQKVPQRSKERRARP